MINKLGKKDLKQNFKIRKLLKIFLLVILGLFVSATIWVFVWMNFYKADLRNRALVIVVESNGSLVPEDVQFYRDHKKIADFFLTSFLGVKKNDLETKDFLSVLDTSIDEGMAKMIKKFTKGYGKTIVLTSETAKFENFLKTLKLNTNSGYTSDIMLFIHGGENSLYFKSELIPTNNLPKLMTGQNLGFVYQVNCYGKTNSQAWFKSGAKVVSGTAGVNSMSLISPFLFIRFIARRTPYARAVNNAYSTEVSFWKITRFIIPGIFWTDPESIILSKPVFIGDQNLRL